MKNAISNLHIVQKTLKIGKNQKNNFGGFKYRTAEDICQAVNAVLPENCIVITDAEIDAQGLITATAKFYSIEENGNEECIVARAFAYISEHKGMSREQICGAGISYARKYALCNLFNIGTGEDDIDAMPPKKDIEIAKKVAERAKIALMKLNTPSEINETIAKMTAQMPKYKAVIENVGMQVIDELNALNDENTLAAHSHSEE